VGRAREMEERGVEREVGREVVMERGREGRGVEKGVVVERVVVGR
jgi:hypothetical protein